MAILMPELKQIYVKLKNISELCQPEAAGYGGFDVFYKKYFLNHKLAHAICCRLLNELGYATKDGAVVLSSEDFKEEDMEIDFTNPLSSLSDLQESLVISGFKEIGWELDIIDLMGTAYEASDCCDSELEYNELDMEDIASGLDSVLCDKNKFFRDEISSLIENSISEAIYAEEFYILHNYRLGVVMENFSNKNWPEMVFLKELLEGSCCWVVSRQAHEWTRCGVNHYSKELCYSVGFTYFTSTQTEEETGPWMLDPTSVVCAALVEKTIDLLLENHSEVKEAFVNGRAA